MDAAEERVLDVLLPRPKAVGFAEPETSRNTRASVSARCCAKAASTSARSRSSCAVPVGVEIMAPPGMEELSQQLQGMFRTSAAIARARRLKVAEAFKLLTEEEAAKLVNEDELKVQALRNAEQRHRVHRRDRQDREAPGNGRRRRPRGRAA